MPTPLTKNLAILGYAGYAQAGISTANSEQDRYPAANLGNGSLWERVWRSRQGEITGVEVTVNLRAPKTFRGVAMIGCNFDLTATRSIVFSNNADLSSPSHTVALGAAFDTSLPRLRTAAPPWGRNMIYLRADDLITAQYYRWTINDPNNANGYLRGAINLAEPAWQPRINILNTYGRRPTFAGDEGIVQTLRGFQIPLQGLSAAEESQIVSLAESAQRTERLLFIPQPLAPATWIAQAIWGSFLDAPDAASVDKRGRFNNVSLACAEVDV